MAWTERKGKGHRGVYRDAQGVKRPTKQYSSKRAALAAAREAETDVARGDWFDPAKGKLTFSDYFENQWLPNRGGELNTREYYLSCYRATLKDRFGEMPLRSILPSTVQGWVTEMSEAKVKPSTIKAKVKALQVVLAGKRGVSAVRDGLIQTNPCEGVMLPTVVDPEVLIFQPEEVTALIEALDPWWRVLALLASESGLRWGELLGLLVSDFSLDARSVTVRHTVVELNSTRTGTGTPFARKEYPKGKRLRVVALRAVAAQAVTTLIAERGLGPNDRLFTMPDKTAPPEWHAPLALEWEPLRTDAWPEGLPISRSHFRDV